jgi:hypothetical protein
MCVVEQRADGDRKGATTGLTLPSTDGSIAASMTADGITGAVRASWPASPPDRLKVLDGELLRVKGAEELNSAQRALKLLGSKIQGELRGVKSRSVLGWRAPGRCTDVECLPFV